jgi:hypothetical protein
MRHTQDVGEFICYNHSEVSSLVATICTDLDFADHIDDVVQNLYAKFLTRKTLQRFDPKFNGGSVKISTYLHTVIVNMVKAMRSEKENKIQFHRYKFQYTDPVKRRFYDDPYFDEVEMAIHTEGMDVNYEGNLYANYSIESVNGINFEFNLFEKYLKKVNRTFTLNRRRCQNIKQGSLSLLDVFRLMRRGYSHKSIASMYGISVTFVTCLKTEIKLLMIKYGFAYGCRPKE